MKAPRSLTPGWCHARTLTLDSAALEEIGAPRAFFPPDTRAGIIERCAPTKTSQERIHCQPSPFIAVAEQVSPRQLLALFQRGLCGLVLTQPVHPSHHTRVLGLALGLPIALWPDLKEAPPHLTLDTTRGAPSLIERDLRFTSGHRRVLPLSLLARSHNQQQWVELVSGQTEERWLARRALEQRWAAGVGLLRLEFVLYSDPKIGRDELRDFLATLFTELNPYPVAVRLTDWSKEKRPCAEGPLQAWSGQRGLEGILTTGALTSQVNAIESAAKLAQHRRVWCVAPHTESLHSFLHMKNMLSATRAGAMLETPKAIASAEEFARHADGIWIGLGDLSSHLSDSGSVSEALQGLNEGSLKRPVFVCGPLPQG